MGIAMIAMRLSEIASRLVHFSFVEYIADNLTALSLKLLSSYCSLYCFDAIRGG
jgi:hypothetical protein